MLSSEPAAAIPQQQQQSSTAHRSPGRPFEPGRSGNPAGRRTKPVDLGELCRKHAHRAVKALVRQLASSDAQAAVNAAKVLLAHAYGEPLAHHALHVPRISVVCSTGESEARANGEDNTQPGRWDA